MSKGSVFLQNVNYADSDKDIYRMAKEDPYNVLFAHFLINICAVKWLKFN